MSSCDYASSLLWRSGFGDLAGAHHRDKIDRLRVSFLDFRDKVTHLTAYIMTDCPNLTLHDVPNHIDCLWGLASTIAGSEYKLTPSEVFVLGGTFLLHDAGLSLAALPRRLDELRERDDSKMLWSSHSGI